MLSSKARSKLEVYSKLEGTEISDYVSGLLYVRDFSEPHGMSTEFSESIDKELLFWLHRFETETKIETRSEPRPDFVHKELVWIEEDA